MYQICLELQKANFLFQKNDQIDKMFINVNGHIDIKLHQGNSYRVLDRLRPVSINKGWQLDRDPYLIEKCIPRVLASDDMRGGAMNRLVLAVLKGPMSISFVDQYLAEV